MQIKLKVHSAWEIKEPQNNNMQTHEYEKGGEKKRTLQNGYNEDKSLKPKNALLKGMPYYICYKFNY
jgi:hypothetical protein